MLIIPHEYSSCTHTAYRRICVTSAAGILDTLCTAEFISCFDPILFNCLIHSSEALQALHIHLRICNHTGMPCHLNLHKNNMLNVFTLSAVICVLRVLQRPFALNVSSCTIYACAADIFFF